MSFSRATRGVLLVFTGFVLLFIHVPLALVVLNSFNISRTFEWPPPGYTTQWWSAAWDSEGARNAIVVSVEVALVALRSRSCWARWRGWRCSGSASSAATPSPC